MNAGKSWIAPATGVLFVVLFVAIFVLIGEGQDASEKTAQEIADHYKDNDVKETAAALLMGLAGIVSLFFGGWLRRVLRDAEGPDGILSAVAFGGAVVFSAGAAVAGSIHLVLPDLADDIDPVALQAVNAIDFDMFMFFPVGIGTMLIAAGISAIRHGSLPKWLAWLGIVVAVLFATPAFFVGFIGIPLWILIVSIMGIMRSGDGSPAAV
jgi:Domain of unknown function (DUF4386)